MTLRIVAIADTHTFESELQLPDGDVLVHAGDLCRSGSLRELEGVARWLRDQPHRHKIVVAGNHDWAFVKTPREARAILGEQICYLEDSGVEIEGVRFWGSPWQPEFHGWCFNLPRGPELAAKWAMIAEDTHVLITHGPPDDIGDHTKTEGRTGCQDLRARVATIAPKLHMFGHIHEDGGAWFIEQTWYANVTTWECERAATVFDLDLQTGTATPVHIPPRR
ncbi:MAG: metallophosphatase domain-containing protein [Deltaproteobacteria bacterium]|nr:metallophosphatase domain-containing protein [Deltaproteobacteria bacterium]